MLKTKKPPVERTKRHQECESAMLPVRDALAVLNGQWKLQILIVLSNGPKRFKEISKEIGSISDKMLSKELKDLEMNHLVTRSVFDTFPPTVEYSATEHSKSLSPVIESLRYWGMLHRKKVMAR